MNSTIHQKEGNNCPTTVIYVVCPFPEPVAVLQTLEKSSTALGSISPSLEKERRSLLQSQVGKALSFSAAANEASISNVLTLSGLSIPKLVLQIVTVESILRISSPALNELVLLKEIAFTVYNKVRRITRSPGNDGQSLSGTTGSSLSKEGELDGSLRSWDNSWQTSRAGVLSCEPMRSGDNSIADAFPRYTFEPLFILAELRSIETGISPTVPGNGVTESLRLSANENNGGAFMQTSTSSGCADSAGLVFYCMDQRLMVFTAIQRLPIFIVAMGGHRIGAGLFVFGQILEENCLTVIYSRLVVSVVVKTPKVYNAFLFKFCNKVT